MKLILVALMLVLTVKAWDEEKYILKKWTQHKAMEGCFGKDMTKAYMVRKKQAFAKCSKIDSPLLDLPIFQAPFKTVGALVHSAYSHEDGKDHHHHAHSHEQQMQYDNEQDDNKFEGKLLQYFIEKAVKDALEDEQEPSRFDNQYRKYFKQRRYQRDTEEEQQKNMLEIGDRLNNKLQELRQKMSEKVGNMTCVLKECAILDNEGKFNDVEAILEHMNEFQFPDPWLKARIESDVRLCHEKASVIPEGILNECVFGPDMAKVKCYKKCLKNRKMKSCMNYDIKQQLEANFAPLPDLVEQTDLEEKELLPLVYKLLHGDEEKNM